MGGGESERREERGPIPEGIARFRPTDATSLTEDPEDTLAHLVRLTTRALEVSLAYVALIDGRRFIIASQDGLSAPATGLGQFEAAGSWSEAALARREPLVLNDSSGHRGNPEFELIGSLAHVAVPLEMPDGEMVGTLCAGSDGSHTWTPRDLEMLAHLTQATTLVLRNRQTIHATHSMSDLLRRMAEPIRDLSSHVRSLTGLVAGVDDPRVRTFAALADSRVRALVPLSREIQMATQSAHERPPGGRRIVDVVELVRRSLASARAAVGSTDVFLDTSPTAITAEVDPLELEESLTALLISVMHFAGAGGQIRVRVAMAGETARVDIVKLGPEVPIAEVARMIGQFRLGGHLPDAMMRLTGHAFSAGSGPIRARTSPNRTAFRVTLPVAGVG